VADGRLPADWAGGSDSLIDTGERHSL